MDVLFLRQLLWSWVQFWYPWAQFRYHFSCTDGYLGTWVPLTGHLGVQIEMLGDLLLHFGNLLVAILESCMDFSDLGHQIDGMGSRVSLLGGLGGGIHARIQRQDLLKAYVFIRFGFADFFMTLDIILKGFGHGDTIFVCF